MLNEGGCLFGGLFQLHLASAGDVAPHPQLSMEHNHVWQGRHEIHSEGSQYMPAHGTIDPRAIFGPFQTEWGRFTPTAHCGSLELSSPIDSQQQVDNEIPLICCPLIVRQIADQLMYRAIRSAPSVLQVPGGSLEHVTEGTSLPSPEDTSRPVHGCAVNDLGTTQFLLAQSAGYERVCEQNQTVANTGTEPIPHPRSHHACPNHTVLDADYSGGPVRPYLRSTTARRARAVVQQSQTMIARTSHPTSSFMQYSGLSSPDSATSREPPRTPAPPNSPEEQESPVPPTYIRELPDGFMDSLVACMTKDTETEEGSQKVRCLACNLMQTKRNPTDLTFSRRHVSEVHVLPLSMMLKRGEKMDARLDALWMALVAVKAKRRRGKPSQDVRAEADRFIEALRRPIAERPLAMTFPRLRAWGPSLANEIEGWQCPVCLIMYTRKSSLDRHNCRGVPQE